MNQHAHYQDSETKAAKKISTIIHCIINTCGLFSNVMCQCFPSETFEVGI